MRARPRRMRSRSGCTGAAAGPASGPRLISPLSMARWGARLARQPGQMRPLQRRRSSRQPRPPLYSSHRPPQLRQANQRHAPPASRPSRQSGTRQRCTGVGSRLQAAQWPWAVRRTCRRRRLCWRLQPPHLPLWRHPGERAIATVPLPSVSSMYSYAAGVSGSCIGAVLLMDGWCCYPRTAHQRGSTSCWCSSQHVAIEDAQFLPTPATAAPALRQQSRLASSAPPSTAQFARLSTAPPASAGPLSAGASTAVGPTTLGLFRSPEPRAVRTAAAAVATAAKKRRVEGGLPDSATPAADAAVHTAGTAGLPQVGTEGAAGVEEGEGEDMAVDTALPAAAAPAGMEVAGTAGQQQPDGAAAALVAGAGAMEADSSCATSAAAATSPCSPAGQQQPLPPQPPQQQPALPSAQEQEAEQLEGRGSRESGESGAWATSAECAAMEAIALLGAARRAARSASPPLSAAAAPPALAAGGGTQQAASSRNHAARVPVQRRPLCPPPMFAAAPGGGGAGSSPPEAAPLTRPGRVIDALTLLSLAPKAMRGSATPAAAAAAGVPVFRAPAGAAAAAAVGKRACPPLFKSQALVIPQHQGPAPRWVVRSLCCPACAI